MHGCRACCCARQADGHCLYRSLEDQLQQQAAAAGSDGQQQQQPQQQQQQQQPGYQQLRELAAQHIRKHK
jgi:hypothetical protein